MSRVGVALPRGRPQLFIYVVHLPTPVASASPSGRVDLAQLSEACWQLCRTACSQQRRGATRRWRGTSKRGAVDDPLIDPKSSVQVIGVEVGGCRPHLPGERAASMGQTSMTHVNDKCAHVPRAMLCMYKPYI